MNSPNSGKAWSKERLQAVYSQHQSEHPEEISNLVAPSINKPLHQNSIARVFIVLSGAALVGLVGWIAFSRSPNSTPVASEAASTTVKPEDIESNSEGWKVAATQGTANGIPVDVPKPPTPTPTATPVVKPTPVAPVVKASPASTPAPPQIIYKTNTVYKTQPPVKSAPVPIPVSKSPPSSPSTAPRPVIIAKAPAMPRPSPQSFIPLGGAGSVQNRPVRTASSTPPRTKRKPLASENILLGGINPNKISVTATIVPGTTITGHLLSPMQSSGGNQNTPGATAIKVALDQPLTTTGGYQIPKGAFVSFLATINPQNGSVTAVSGNAWANGKVISIPQGAISIQSTDKQPLIANSFAPKTGDLANADRNNAFLGAAGEVGNELTKGSSSINVGNGATIIQNSSNPNIVGAVLKGGFQTWATDQRQRTQANASKILASQPVQYLPQGTPVILTVNSPATIRVSQ